MRKIYTKKSQADGELLNICETACQAIRSMIGDERYRRSSSKHEAGFSAAILEHYLVGAAALIYGNGRSFVQLAKLDLEREALQFQRHIMEYYFRARYYRENPQWAEFYWARSIVDERDFLKEVISQHGSRQYLMQLERDAPIAETQLVKVPKKDKAKICPSIAVLAKKYAINGSDYVMLYRWPSQITHATFLGMNYAWMPDGTPRFDSEIPNINARASVVADYLISFIETIQDSITVAADVNAEAIRQRLRSSRTRLNLQLKATKKRSSRKPIRKKSRYPTVIR
jgi:Family of unknown function (DUF5677)